jgi:Virulence activator alpha C-term
LFFGGLSDREAVRGPVRQRRQEAERMASELRQIEPLIEASEEWIYPHLRLKYGLARAEAIVSSADAALRILGGGLSR